MPTSVITDSIDSVSPKRLMTRRLMEHGYTLREFKLLDVPYLEFTAPNGWKWVTRKYFIPYPFVSTTAHRIANDKNQSYAFAEFMGANIPRTQIVSSPEVVIDQSLLQRSPLVVKPATSFGSHGLALDITTAKDAQAAISEALHYSKEVLVQQQFVGNEARFTVIRGKLVSCIVRETPRVVGDGNSSIMRLLELENKQRKLLMNNKLVPYPLLDETIIPVHYFSDTTVPGRGEAVIFSKSTLPNSGASIREITSTVHPSYEDIACRLGAALNSEFAVIDMIIADYLAPADDTNYIFLEVTLSPSLRLYYDVRSGQDYDILGTLIGMIDEMSTRNI